MRNCLWVLVGSAVVAFAGCNSGDQAYHEVSKGARVKDQPHSHEEGPHGGHLVELGEEEYHAEVVLDPKASKITLYILDSSAKKAAPIDAKEVKLELTMAGQPKPLTAKAVPDKDDPANKSSRFEIAGNADVKANIKDEEDLKGSVTVPVASKTYTGKIVHEH